MGYILYPDLKDDSLLLRSTGLFSVMFGNSMLPTVQLRK